MTYEQLLKDIQQKKFAPVYYLHGEETYFTDKLTHALEEGVLNAGEDTFNKSVFYGGETTANKVMTDCRSFPVMANRRLVILKEAQGLAKKEFERFTDYLKKPALSTVFVLAFKPKEAGKEGAALPKAAIKNLTEANGIDFAQKRMYDKDVKAWAHGLIAAAETPSDTGIADILVENLGPNLPLIESEWGKIMLYAAAIKQPKITKAIVYDSINVDKEFNVFELVNALCEKDVFRAQMITDRLTRNTKINPPIVTVSALFRLFHNLSLVYAKQLSDVNAIKDVMGLNYYAAKDYASARTKYSAGVAYRNLALVQEADLMLKGILPTQMEEAHILKTLVWRILH